MQKATQTQARYELRIMAERSGDRLEGRSLGDLRERFEVRTKDDLFALASIPSHSLEDIVAIWPVRAGKRRMLPSTPHWLEQALGEIEARLFDVVRRIPGSLCVPEAAVDALGVMQAIERGKLDEACCAFILAHATKQELDDRSDRRGELKRWAARLRENTSMTGKVMDSIRRANVRPAEKSPGAKQ